MKKTIFNILAVMSLAILVVSCGGRSKNRKLVEAHEIHNAMMAKHDSIYEALKIQDERVTKKLATMSQNNPDRAAFQSMERSIKRSFGLLEKWKSSVADVPGFDQNKPADKNENPQDKVNLKGMSDQEILDLENAYSDKLDQIGQKIGELITTMDMYTKND